MRCLTLFSTSHIKLTQGGRMKKFAAIFSLLLLSHFAPAKSAHADIAGIGAYAGVISEPLLSVFSANVAVRLLDFQFNAGIGTNFDWGWSYGFGAEWHVLSFLGFSPTVGTQLSFYNTGSTLESFASFFGTHVDDTITMWSFPFGVQYTFDSGLYLAGGLNGLIWGISTSEVVFDYLPYIRVGAFW